MELQYRVMPPDAGVAYPLVGFTMIAPTDSVPAGTLLGESVLCTVIVYDGATASTVNESGCELCVPEASVPVITMV
jgi:hypothetical protein